MELSVDIGINQIMGLIRQLPVEKKLILKKEIDQELSELQPSDDELTKLLLEGPVMSNSENEDFKANRKVFSKWTEKLFA
jgi:hypothetical protein